jgi:hypothetical protein
VVVVVVVVADPPEPPARVVVIDVVAPAAPVVVTDSRLSVVVDDPPEPPEPPPEMIPPWQAEAASATPSHDPAPSKGARFEPPVLSIRAHLPGQARYHLLRASDSTFTGEQAERWPVAHDRCDRREKVGS